MGNEHDGKAKAVFFSLNYNGLNTYANLRYVMGKSTLINVTDQISLLGLLPHLVAQKALNSNFCH